MAGADLVGPFTDFFSRPFTFVDGSGAPETRRTWRAAAIEARHNRLFPVRSLGRRPGVFLYRSSFPVPPGHHVHELRNSAMYYSLVFSRGGVFPESLRYRQPGRITGFSLPRLHNPRPLGNGYFAYIKRPETGRAAYYQEPCLPFHTVHEYGHYLIEWIPTLWYLENCPWFESRRPRLLVYPQAADVPQYLLELTEPFGLKRDDFLIPEPFSIFRTLYLTGRPHMEAQYVTPAALATWARIGAYYASRAPADGPDKIYVTRRNVLRRKLMNEDRVEEIMSARGFVSVDPAALPLSRQAALFAGAKMVAGPLGSGLHNLLFSLRPGRVKTLLLVPRNFVAANVFWRLEQACGRPVNCVFGRYLNPESAYDVQATIGGQWELDLDDLNAALDQWLGP